MAMILVTHDLGVVAGRADEIAVMYAGQIVEKGADHGALRQHADAVHRGAAQVDPEARRSRATPASTASAAARPTSSTRRRAAGSRPAAPTPRTRCLEEEPPLIEADTPGHLYRCWFPVGTPASKEALDRNLAAARRRPARRSLVERRPTAAVPTVDRPDGRHRHRPPPARPRPAAAGRGPRRRVPVGPGPHGEGGVRHQPRRPARARRSASSASPGAASPPPAGRSCSCRRRPAGRVLLRGQRPHDAAAATSCARSGRGMQLIFQDPISSLNPRRTVDDIVAEPLRIWGIGTDGGAARPRSTRCSSAVGLDPEVARPKRPHQFSGGQCQRISIARALVLDPKLIICDEPVSALDVSVQAQILNLLEDMKARYGLTLVFIAHDLAVVKNVSDRVAVMYLGKLCEVGAPRRALRHAGAPLHGGAAVGDPGARPDRRPAATGIELGRRPAVADRPAERAAGSAPAARGPRSAAPRRSRCCGRCCAAPPPASPSGPLRRLPLPARRGGGRGRRRAAACRGDLSRSGPRRGRRAEDHRAPDRHPARPGGPPRPDRRGRRPAVRGPRPGRGDLRGDRRRRRRVAGARLQLLRRPRRAARRGVPPPLRAARRASSARRSTTRLPDEVRLRRIVRRYLDFAAEQPGAWRLLRVGRAARAPGGAGGPARCASSASPTAWGGIADGPARRLRRRRAARGGDQDWLQSTTRPSPTGSPTCSST